MASGVSKAKRQLRSFGRNGGNWRLKGLFLAGLPTTRVSGSDVARAWPTTKSDYRFLSGDIKNHDFYGPDRHLSVPENSEDYRRLSDATKNSDWDDGVAGTKEIHLDRAIQRTLAFEDSIEEFDTLWRDQLLDTVIQGAQKNQVARDAANVINVETRTGDHPRAQDDRFARDVAEGGAIRDDRNNPDTVSWDAQKFGEGARATEELIDHALVDEIERQVEDLGRQCENKINRIFLNELLDNVDTSNDVDTSTPSNKSLASVNQAIANIEGQDFEPDSIVMHPQYTQTFFDEGQSTIPVAVNESGDDMALRDRMAFPLLGLEGFRASGGVADGSTTWNFTGADEFGAVVYQRDMMGLYMYRDIEVKDYDDPIRDLQGVNARAQVDAVWNQPSAGARLEHS
jgi:hypothetical protein